MPFESKQNNEKAEPTLSFVKNTTKDSSFNDPFANEGLVKFSHKTPLEHIQSMDEYVFLAIKSI